MATPNSTNGGVKVEDVVGVLKQHGVSVTVEYGSKARFTLRRGKIVEVHFFPDVIHRRMIEALAEKFKIDLHFFYHFSVTDH